MCDNITKLIAVEEHFMLENVDCLYNQISMSSVKDSIRISKAQFIADFVAKGEITEVGEKRLAYMDAKGIDIQILSYGNNSPMSLNAEDAIPLCKLVNDELASLCKKAPKRFYGFATLPVADISASVSELERCVNELKFKGIMLNGTYGGHFFDEYRFYPIFERAASLNIPVMIHPGEVDTAVSKHYYQGIWSSNVTNIFGGHGIGWHYDCGMQYIRMILSGIFDRLPGLTLICGHWGETLPYYFNRLDTTLTPSVTGLCHEISYYFKNNMYLTPSGMFFDDDLLFCLDKVGANRILWATDYPYCKPENSKDYLASLPISLEQKEKIAHINAECLFDI